jgi:hypothetical protein
MTTLETAAAADYGTVAHTLPGRIRLRVQSIRSDWARAAEVEERLSALDIVESVSANPRSGSVVVEYVPDGVGLSDLLARMSDALGIEIATPPKRHPDATGFVDSDEVAARVRTIAGSANKRVAELAGGLDLRLLVPGALFFFGAGALLGARRRRMPEWYTLLWYAFSTFQSLNRARPGS